MGLAQSWFVYMIRADDNSLYTGITTDPKRRLSEHQSDKKRQAKYFKGRNAINIVYLKCAEDRTEAAKLEYFIKQLTKKHKEALVNGELALESLS